MRRRILISMVGITAAVILFTLMLLGIGGDFTYWLFRLTGFVLVVEVGRRRLRG